MLVMGGCAGGPTQDNQGAVQTLEQRIQALERRVAQLEQQSQTDVRLYPTQPEARSPDPAAQNEALRHLRDERQRLLQRYTPSHPDIRLLEREIRRLQQGDTPDPRPLRQLPRDLPTPGW